jgi:hypothetical protein
MWRLLRERDGEGEGESEAEREGESAGGVAMGGNFVGGPL